MPQMYVMQKVSPTHMMINIIQVD